MIDHISIAVRDLTKGEKFYTAALAPLGFSKLKEWPGAAIGFGKKYPEFWINKREALGRVAEDSGVHICLRAPDTASVDAFHAAALKKAAHPTASQARGRTITKDITRLSSAIPTAIASKR
jgi:catechol 2,3-dioxygenase-like lactoylglutathione lyase family enzyme